MVRPAIASPHHGSPKPRGLFSGFSQRHSNSSQPRRKSLAASRVHGTLETKMRRVRGGGDSAVVRSQRFGETSHGAQRVPEIA
jgi:hypothetical protein